ncbi:glycoside hydrolase family 13 protein [Rhodococcus sp. NPDC059968]|uniref:glycoside hydrolase family 13 protein n=1 Tax=Rhodococcus sp. NPDC059968 TaxID=3347017 RepID=UPI00366C353D
MTNPSTTVDRYNRDIDDPTAWWKSAIVYQVYIRSFADGNGDGIGDLVGLRSRLPYLASLGIDAVWINPWYPSPMIDAGYDVSNFRGIEPTYGSLDDAEAFITEAHDLDIKVLIDIVPNHVSSQHPWFEAALAGEIGARDRFHFRPGRGANGEEPPNDWSSYFGGPAWTRLDDGSWYLHLFAPAQPDLNWEQADVRREYEDILRFWFDRGVDGFRIDMANGLVKHPDLPDAGPIPLGLEFLDPHPAWDRDGVHDIYRGWRAVADCYGSDRVFVAEAWVPNNDRLALYLRPDELHTAFQFDFLRAPWRADNMRTVIDSALEQARSIGAPATWVLSNHDVPRTVTRYARSQPDHFVEVEWERQRWSKEVPDIDLGRRRGRAAALLQFALPGTAYIYQGEELGLEEIESIPDEARRDPTWIQSGFTDVGRDGCRIPIPWSGDDVPYGFSLPASAADAWLPQPAHWGSSTARSQDTDPASMLSLYRHALAIRSEIFANDEPVIWIDSPADTLAFSRGRAQCWINFGEVSIEPPTDMKVVLSSNPNTPSELLAANEAVWLLSE